MAIQKLGIFKALHIGTTAPTNTNLIWYDDNVGQKIHKAYNTVSGTWESLGAIPAVDYSKFDTWRTVVLDTTIADPSSLSPSTGDRYLVPASAIGDWTGQDDNIATRNGSIWEFETPEESWVIISVAQRGQLYVYETSTWESYDLTTEGDIKSDGSIAFTGNVDLGANKLTNVAVPTLDDDAATKGYADQLLETLTEIVLNDSGFTSTISTETLTANRAIDFQDKDGIVALLSDLNIQTSNIDPVGQVSPNRQGSIYVRTDTTPKQVYVAQSTSNTSWIRLNLEYNSGSGVKVTGTNLELGDISSNLSLVGLGFSYALNKMLSYTIGAQADTIDGTGRGEMKVSRGKASLFSENSSNEKTGVEATLNNSVLIYDAINNKGLKIVSGNNSNLDWATDNDYYPTIGDIKNNTNASKTAGNGINYTATEIELGDLSKNTYIFGDGLEYGVVNLDSYAISAYDGGTGAKSRLIGNLNYSQIASDNSNNDTSSYVRVKESGETDLYSKTTANGTKQIRVHDLTVEDDALKGLKNSSTPTNVNWTTDNRVLPDIGTIKANLGQSSTYIDDQVNYKLTRVIKDDGGIKTVLVKLWIKDQTTPISDLVIIPKGVGGNYFNMDSFVSMILTSEYGRKSDGITFADVGTIPSTATTFSFNKLIDHDTVETFGLVGYYIGEAQRASLFGGANSDPGAPSYLGNIECPDISTTNGEDIKFTLTPEVGGPFSVLTRELVIKGTLIGDDY